MINSHLIQTNTRAALAARDILLIKPKGTLAALLLMLSIGVAALAGSPSVNAQEQQSAAMSAAIPSVASVNINTADAPALEAGLKGVGESRAQEIVRYRETYGPFSSAEELTEVKGIGKSTLDNNRDVITLE